MGTPDLVYDHRTIADLSQAVADSIKGSPIKLDGLIGNLNGGLVPVALVAVMTGLPIIGLMQTKRYPGTTRDAVLPPVLLRRIEPHLVAGMAVGLIDDVGDELLSADCCVGHLKECGARHIQTGVLDWKPTKSKVPGFVPDHVARVHEGTPPWIHYGPWEDDGATHERALWEFVEQGYVPASYAQQIVTLLRVSPQVAS